MREGLPLKTFGFRVLVGMLLMAGILVILAGAFVLYSPKGTVIDVAKSPDGKIEARVRKIGGGAMASDGYSVDLKGLSPETGFVRVADFNAAIKDEKTDGVNLVWIDERTLELRYISAHFAALDRASVTLNGQTVAIRLSPPYKMAPAGMTACDRPGDCPVDMRASPR